MIARHAVKIIAVIARLQLFAFEPEPLSVDKAVMTNRHIKEGDPRFLTDDSVRPTHDRLLAMLALKIHEQRLSAINVPPTHDSPRCYKSLGAIGTSASRGIRVFFWMTDFPVRI